MPSWSTWDIRSTIRKRVHFLLEKWPDSMQCYQQDTTGIRAQEYTVKALTDIMVDAKENIDNNFLASLHVRNLDPIKALSKILGSCLEEQLQHQSPEVS
ncbi:hypothetical protein Ancab_031069 [Ancistrocladus abbreviatus]